jgi:hypothetical protein
MEGEGTVEVQETVEEGGVDNRVSLPVEYVEMEMDYSTAYWRLVFKAALIRALWPVLMPTMIIWSRLRRRPVRIGVTKEKGGALTDK